MDMQMMEQNMVDMELRCYSTVAAAAAAAAIPGYCCYCPSGELLRDVHRSLLLPCIYILLLLLYYCCCTTTVLLVLNWKLTHLAFKAEIAKANFKHTPTVWIDLHSSHNLPMFACQIF